MTQTQTLKRYEQALRIALERAEVPTEEKLTKNPHLLDLYVAGLEYIKENVPDAPLIARWSDVERIVNTLEAIEREIGIPHVRPVPTHRRDGAALARLEALGYDVRTQKEIGPWDGKIWWVAEAFYQGQLVGRAWGTDREEALAGLMRELGVSL
jgi:hypothetical protein